MVYYKMAASSITDLLRSSAIVFTVADISHGTITLHDESGEALVLPKTLVVGSIKIGDQVQVTIRSKLEVDRVSRVVAKDVLQEMLRDD